METHPSRIGWANIIAFQRPYRVLYLVPAIHICRGRDSETCNRTSRPAGEMSRDVLVAKLLSSAVRGRKWKTRSRNSPRSMRFSATCRKRTSRRSCAGLPPAAHRLNTTNQCNSCMHLLLRYSEDKIAQSAARKIHEQGVAEASVEMLIKESAHRPNLHVTFFGGETLLILPSCARPWEYAKRRGEEEGKKVEFSLTTNGTLLTEEIVDFLSEHRIG